MPTINECIQHMYKKIEHDIIEDAKMTLREVSRGETESPALAALMFEHRIRGNISAVRHFDSLYLELLTAKEYKPQADYLQHLADKFTMQIDPEWRENRQRRYAAKPCSLSFEMEYKK